MSESGELMDRSSGGETILLCSHVDKLGQDDERKGGYYHDHGITSVHKQVSVSQKAWHKGGGVLEETGAWQQRRGSSSLDWAAGGSSRYALANRCWSCYGEAFFLLLFFSRWVSMEERVGVVMVVVLVMMMMGSLNLDRQKGHH